MNKDGIHTNPEKVEAIRNLAAPKTVKELRRFLGMAGYYRNCIKNFADIAISLTELTKKKARWNGGSHNKRL